MRDVLIIKIYRNDFLSDDYHDLVMDSYEKTFKKLKKEAERHGKKLVLTSSFGSTVDNIIPNVPYIEILYSGILSSLEKDKYLAIARRFFSDVKRFGVDREMVEIYPEIIVKISEIPSGDVIEILPALTPADVRNKKN
mgnify:CR=1 FL=1